jgi:hypothetical protein
MSAAGTHGDSATRPRPPRRFGLRFSLRTFLAAITLMCVLLAWQLHKAKEQREAVAAIRAAGGWVHYDYELIDVRLAKTDPQARPWEPEWLLALVGIDFFHDVVEVNMVYNEDGPQRLDNEAQPTNIAPHLAHFPQLRGLLLSGNFIDDEGMRQVGRLKRLEIFYQWEGRHITDAGAAHLQDMPRLTYIHLGSSQVGDRGLAAIASLPSLEGLCMQRNRITDAGLAHLAGHRKLKELWIGSLNAPSPISDAGVVHLAQIPNLEELDLQYTRVTPAGLVPLQALPNLKNLLLSGSLADDYTKVAPLLPNCRIDAAKPPPIPTTLPSSDL